jgi:predicted DNA-binding transcriptional regulator AlpA
MTNPNKSRQPDTPYNGERLLNRRMLRQTIPASDMTIWRWERDGVFPQHLVINGRNYWLRSEVMEWLARQKRGQRPRRREEA